MVEVGVTQEDMTNRRQVDVRRSELAKDAGPARDIEEKGLVRLHNDGALLAIGVRRSPCTQESNLHRAFNIITGSYRSPSLEIVA